MSNFRKITRTKIIKIGWFLTELLNKISANAELADGDVERAGFF